MPASKDTPRVSLRQAINAKCKECIYDPECGGGNWRQQTAACTSYSCPLYSVRPISRPRKKNLKVETLELSSGAL